MGRGRGRWGEGNEKGRKRVLKREREAKVGETNEKCETKLRGWGGGRETETEA